MTDLTPAELRALERALTLAETSPYPPGPNPRVGCVLLDARGDAVSEGIHLGAGTPHAEAAALRALPDGVCAHTAVVSLEPCRHTGRTPPCTTALIAAGVRRVVVAHLDPTPAAGGGARLLREAGLEVLTDVPSQPAERAAAVLRPWLFVLENGRTWVTWKTATTLDGRSAARDGSSRWITSSASRRDVHRLRSEHDVVLVGTGTVLADDPELTVRSFCSDSSAVPASQSARAVMGLRDVPPTSRLATDGAGYHHLRTRSVPEALAQLRELGHRRVLLEGGPTLAAAFLRAGVVDEVVAYIAPALLGAGTPMLGDVGIDTVANATRLTLVEATTLEAAGTARGTAGGSPSPLGDLRLTLLPTTS